MVERFQRYRSSSIQEYWCFESWKSGQEEWQRHHTLPCGCFEHRTLVPNRDQLSIYGAVANWCELDVNNSAWQKKNRDKKDLLEGKNPWPMCVDMCEITWSETDGIFSKTGIRKQCAGKHVRTWNCWPRQFDPEGFANMHRSRTGYQLGWTTKLDLTRTTVLGRSFHYAENTRLLEWTHNPEPLQQFLEKQSLDLSLKFKSWTFLTNMDLKSHFHHLTNGTDILCYDFQRKYEVHIPTARPRSSAELLTEVQKSERRRVLLRTVKYLHPGDWCDPCFKLY